MLTIMFNGRRSNRLMGIYLDEDWKTLDYEMENIKLKNKLEKLPIKKLKKFAFKKNKK